MVYAVLVLSRVDADEARAPRPRASGAARSSTRFAAGSGGRVGKAAGPAGLSGLGFAPASCVDGKAGCTISVNDTFRRLPAAQRL